LIDIKRAAAARRYAIGMKRPSGWSPRMKLSRSIVALLMACAWAPVALAQPKLEVSPSEEYVPNSATS
jgi:hypothetical protein